MFNFQTKDLDPDIKKKGPANQEVKANPKTDKTRTDDQLQKQNDGTKVFSLFLSHLSN